MPNRRPRPHILLWLFLAAILTIMIACSPKAGAANGGAEDPALKPCGTTECTLITNGRSYKATVTTYCFPGAGSLTTFTVANTRASGNIAVGVSIDSQKGVVVASAMPPGGSATNGVGDMRPNVIRRVTFLVLDGGTAQVASFVTECRQV